MSDHSTNPDTNGSLSMPSTDDAVTTVADMRAWLRQWVAATAGISLAEVTDERSMEEFGLSSRDVVVLSGDLERLTGKTLDATVAYEFNTVAALANFLINGRGGAGGTATADTFGDFAAHGVANGEMLAPEDRDIAIVGLAGRYPGAENAKDMWKMMSSYQHGIGEPPAGRWAEYAGDPEMVRRMAEAELVGGYIEDIASFDAEFFGLSPVEAANMDPQQRIVLQLVWEALEDAHIPANTLRGTNVGVFMGTTNNDYGMLIAADPAEAHPYALTGNSTSIIANRVSYAFDFRGPSIALDTACSSSLVAIHQAVRALREGSATLALAGGVNILASPFATVAFSELGVLSPTGAIHAFSEDADGFVRSDGAGVVVLKRLSDARRDGDNVLAVIKGSAVNSDGRSNGLTAPNPDAQVDVLRAAYLDARIDPRQVDYVEAHGTGTILGDPIEATALGAVLGRGREAGNPLLLGSAKTNFGHTEAAAGVAGVIKVVQAIQEGTIPPSLNYSGPNPYIDFDKEHLEVVEDAREWPEYSGQPIAGVSGFGFGGTNAHVIIAADDAAAAKAAAEERAAKPGVGEFGTYLLPVSGLLPSRRKVAAHTLATWMEQHADAAAAGKVDIADVARALAGYNHGRSRGVVVATDWESAVDGLQRIAAGKSGATVKSANAPAPMGPVWVYSGFGSQHRKMGKDLYQQSPVFAASLDEIDAIVRRESGWSILEKMLDDEQTFDTESAQIGITCIQIALTDFLAHLGARPAAVVGQSMGEIAAAYAVGGLSKEDAVLIACHRSRLMGEGEANLPEDKQGAMAVVEFGVEELAKFSAEHPEFAAVEPAVYAAPAMTTVGGPREPVAKLVEYLEGEGKFARLLDVKGAGHTSMLDPILGELHFEISEIAPQAIHTPLYSTVDRGRVYAPGEVVHDADYFVRCTRQPVWFAEATGQQFADGYRTFVEIAPNPVALMPLMNNAFAHDAGDSVLTYVLKRKEPEAQTIALLLAELYSQGMAIDLRAFVGETAGTGGLAAVPGITWNLQRHWTNARPSSSPTVALPGTRVALPTGTVVYSTQAETVPSVAALVDAIAADMQAAQGNESAGAVAPPVIAEHAVLPSGGALTTMVNANLGGWAMQIHDASQPGLPLVAEAFVATFGAIGAGNYGGNNDAAANVTAAPAVPNTTGTTKPTMATNDTATANNKLPELDTSAQRWDPQGTVSVAEHLRFIVSESMGYDVEDLPGELPLIDLGLDSLMGMRIKNRVEFDFDLPPLNVQTLRDGSVDDVIAMVEAMVAQRYDLKAQGGAQTGVEETTAAAEETTTDYTVRQGGVAPRDASERLVFATWAKVTGKAAPGVTSELPAIDAETAEAVAERLSERSGATITATDVLNAATLEPLSDKVRETLETEVEGNIRVLRARGETPEAQAAPAVFLFHPAGGSSAVYQPLTRRLPAHIPVYGVERLEGELSERVAQYLDEIVELAAGKPIILGGWSFGGAVAYEAAHQLLEREAAGQPSATVARIMLLDTVRPLHPAPDTNEEMHARWDRYAAFAQKTYGLPMEIPHELLDEHGESIMFAMFQQFLTSPEAQSMGLPAGVLEHQRASFVDNRILDTLDFANWVKVEVPVTLFRAERMHDGAIELEPAYAEIAPDGGWGEIVEDLQIVQLNGDHLAVVDEPEISKVAAVMAQHLAEL